MIPFQEQRFPILWIKSATHDLCKRKKLHFNGDTHVQWLDRFLLNGNWFGWTLVHWRSFLSQSSGLEKDCIVETNLSLFYFHYLWRCSIPIHGDPIFPIKVDIFIVLQRHSNGSHGHHNQWSPNLQPTFQQQRQSGFLLWVEHTGSLLWPYWCRLSVPLPRSKTTPNGDKQQLKQEWVGQKLHHQKE